MPPSALLVAMLSLQLFAGGLAHGFSSPAEDAGRPSPRGALLRSAVYPGWGQLSNGKPYKACVIMAVEAYLAGVALSSDRLARDSGELAGAASTPAEIAGFERRRARYEDRRNAHFWWLGAAVLYSMLDAYVDANLAGVSEGASKPRPVQLEPRSDVDRGFGFAIVARF